MRIAVPTEFVVLIADDSDIECGKEIGYSVVGQLPEVDVRRSGRWCPVFIRAAGSDEAGVGVGGCELVHSFGDGPDSSSASEGARCSEKWRIRGETQQMSQVAGVAGLCNSGELGGGGVRNQDRWCAAASAGVIDEGLGCAGDGGGGAEGPKIQMVETRYSGQGEMFVVVLQIADEWKAVTSGETMACDQVECIGAGPDAVRAKVLTGLPGVPPVAIRSGKAGLLQGNGRPFQIPRGECSRFGSVIVPDCTHNPMPLMMQGIGQGIHSPVA